MQRLVIAILLGIAFCTVLTAALLSISPIVANPWPVWYRPARAIADAVLAVMPGLLAGWYAGRSGLLVGAWVGAGSTIASLGVVAWLWGSLPTHDLPASIAAGIVASIITQSIGGLAGESLRKK